MPSVVVWSILILAHSFQQLQTQNSMQISSEIERIKNLLLVSEEIFLNLALMPGDKDTNLLLDDAESRIFKISESRNRNLESHFDNLLIV